jgi:hypothetical protein
MPDLTLHSSGLRLIRPMSREVERQRLLFVNMQKSVLFGRTEINAIILPYNVELVGFDGRSHQQIVARKDGLFVTLSGLLLWALGTGGRWIKLDPRIAVVQVHHQSCSQTLVDEGGTGAAKLRQATGMRGDHD